MTAVAEPAAPARLHTADGGAFTAAGLIYGGLTVLCWASYNVASKHGIDAGFLPHDLAVLRFGLAGLILAPVALFAVRLRRRMPNWRVALVLGIVGGPAFSTLAVSGYAYAPLTHGVLFAPAANFIAGSLLGVLWLGEKVGRRHAVGGAVMLAGLGVLSGVDVAALGPETLKGDFLFICTGICWSVLTALMRRWRVDPVGGVLAQGTASALLAPLVWFGLGGGRLFEMPTDEIAIQAVAQTLIGGVGASFAFFAAVGALGAARASMLGPLVPGVAVLLAAAITGEPPRWVDLAGVSIVSFGLLIATGALGRRRGLA